MHVEVRRTVVELTRDNLEVTCRPGRAALGRVSAATVGLGLVDVGNALGPVLVVCNPRLAHAANLLEVHRHDAVGHGHGDAVDAPEGAVVVGRRLVVHVGENRAVIVVDLKVVAMEDIALAGLDVAQARVVGERASELSLLARSLDSLAHIAD